MKKIISDSILAFIAWIGLPVSAMAQTSNPSAPTQNTSASNKDFSIPMASSEILQISLPKANVNLHGEAGASLTIRWHKAPSERLNPVLKKLVERLTLHLSRDGGRIILEPEGNFDPKEWLLLASKDAPELVLDLGVPQGSIQVGIKTGTLRATELRSKLDVTMNQGQIGITKSIGEVRASLQKGELKVENHQGFIRASTSEARVVLNTIEGDTELYLQNGDSSVQSLTGSLTLVAGNASHQVSKSTGKADIQIRRGSLSMLAHEGSLRVKAEDAGVNVQLAGLADANLESKSGTISVKPPDNSGAFVRVQSDEGQVMVPEFLQPTHSGENKIYSGRLKGAEKGSIHLHSATGALRVRL